MFRMGDVVRLKDGRLEDSFEVTFIYEDTNQYELTSLHDGRTWLGN